MVSPDAWTDAVFTGTEYSGIGGAFETAGYLIRLKDGGGMAWAIYSAPGISSARQALGVTLNYGLEPRAGGDHCDAWLGVANYSLERWDFKKADIQPFTFLLPTPKDYISPSGYCHCAVVFDGEGKVRVDSLSFHQYENPPDSPSDFRLSIEGETVQLDWNASGQADTYRLYKSPDTDFGTATLLSSTTAHSYNDSAVAPQERWFYWVVTDNGTASLPSGPLCAVLPEIDLPAPTDFWSPGSDADSFDLAWDWDGPNPDGFTLLMAEDEPNFDPGGQSLESVTLAGEARSYTLGQPRISPRHVYYCRLAAYDLQGITKASGQWTKALPCIAGNIVWAFPETLGPGRAPVRADQTADGLVAVWLYAGTVMCGQRDASGNWDISDTGLNPMLDTYPGQPLPHKGFDQFLDVAYHDGLCLVCAHSADTGDLWAAIGVPGGGWTQEHVLGDRDPLGGTDSGVNLDCAAGPGSGGMGEYSVTCAVFPRDGWGFPQTFLASRPASGNASDWRSFDLSAKAPQLDSCDYPCCEYRLDSGALYLLLFCDSQDADGLLHETVKLGSFESGLPNPQPQWERVVEDGTPVGILDYINQAASSQTQLTVNPSSWGAPGYSLRLQLPGWSNFSVDSQDTSPGSAYSACSEIDERLAGESHGWYPRYSSSPIKPANNKLLFWNSTRQENCFRVAHKSGNEPPYAPISLPGIPGPKADVICSGLDMVFLVYADHADGMVKCAVGTDSTS